MPPPPIETEEQREAYLKDYMPIKFGSPLFSKLRKKYWERPQATTTAEVHASSCPRGRLPSSSGSLRQLETQLQ